jgi:hypothetical protein
MRTALFFAGGRDEEEKVEEVEEGGVEEEGAMEGVTLRVGVCWGDKIVGAGGVVGIASADEFGLEGDGGGGVEDSTSSGGITERSGEGGVGVPMVAGVCAGEERERSELEGEKGVREAETSKEEEEVDEVEEDMCTSVSRSGAGGVGGCWRGTRGAGGREVPVERVREPMLERESSGVSWAPGSDERGTGGAGESGFGAAKPTSVAGTCDLIMELMVRERDEFISSTNTDSARTSMFTKSITHASRGANPAITFGGK